jgi:hypothetical protein
MVSLCSNGNPKTMSVCVCVCVCMNEYVQVYECMNVFVWVCMSMCVCVCVCVYVDTEIKLSFSIMSLSFSPCTRSLTSQLDSLASESLGSSCLLPSVGVTGTRSWILMFIEQAFFPLRHLSRFLKYHFRWKTLKISLLELGTIQKYPLLVNIVLDILCQHNKPSVSISRYNNWKEQTMPFS